MRLAANINSLGLVTIRSIQFLRIAFFFSLFGIALMLVSPVSAQITDSTARERINNASDWDDLCAIEDCSQFPVGYNTYVFGPEVYYFPTWSTMTLKPPGPSRGGVRPGRLYETDSDGRVLRSVSVSPTSSIPFCCHHLLTFFGLAEAMPIFIQSPSGNRMPTTRVGLSRFDDPGRYNKIQRWLDSDLGEFPRLDEVISKDAISYNDDFWVLGVGKKISERGFRWFRLLSKRPLFHGRQVYATCGRDCTFGTMSFSGSENETRPHIQLHWMLLSQGNMFLCSLEDLKNGCDASPDAFDQVPVMLSVLEDMFEAAQKVPQGEEIE